MVKSTALKITVASFLCSLASASGAVVTLVNADFEAATGKIQTGYSTISGWYNMGSTYADSGVESTAGKTLGSGAAALGSYNGFVLGSEAGAYQLGSGYTINAGDTITLTWEAAATENLTVNSVTANGVSLFGVNSSAVAAEGTASTSLAGYTLFASNSAALGGTKNQFNTYTLSYTATALDQGKLLGVSFKGLDAGRYTGFDNFSITAVPEPSTYGLMGAGALAAVALVRRRRKAAATA